jgi:hypothetical protein
MGKIKKFWPFMVDYRSGVTLLAHHKQWCSERVIPEHRYDTTNLGGALMKHTATKVILAVASVIMIGLLVAILMTLRGLNDVTSVSAGTPLTIGDSSAVTDETSQPSGDNRAHMEDDSIVVPPGGSTNYGGDPGQAVREDLHGIAGFSTEVDIESGDRIISEGNLNDILETWAKTTSREDGWLNDIADWAETWEVDRVDVEEDPSGIAFTIGKQLPADAIQELADILGARSANFVVGDPPNEKGFSDYQENYRRVHLYNWYWSPDP